MKDPLILIYKKGRGFEASIDLRYTVFIGEEPFQHEKIYGDDEEELRSRLRIRLATLRNGGR